MKSCFLIVAHGSRSPQAEAELRELIQTYLQTYSDSVPIYLGFIEICPPHFEQVLFDLARDYHKITIVPLSLFAASHIKNDIPLAVQRCQSQFPQVQIVSLPAFGSTPDWIKLVQDLEANSQSLGRLKASPEDSALLVIGRGSSDPDANSEFFKTARLIGEGLGIKQVYPCFIGITSPSLGESLHLLARLRPKQVVVLPFFLFTGVLIERIHEQLTACRSQYSWLSFKVLEYLTRSNKFVELMHTHMNSNQTIPLPCISCQYRVPLGELDQQVGGLKSLLWSIRHQFTHKQAVAHTHAHRMIKSHVLVCTNRDCLEKGSLAVLRQIRQASREQGIQREIKVTRTSCMGLCGEGPCVVVYPDGIWYRGMTEHSGRRLVHEHIMKQELLADHIDQIMN